MTLSDTTISGTYGDMKFKNGVATFSLKGGESAKATGLPNGINYTVKEGDYRSDGYNATYDGKAKGTIQGDATIKTTVKNVFDEETFRVYGAADAWDRYVKKYHPEWLEKGKKTAKSTPAGTKTPAKRFVTRTGDDSMAMTGWIALMILGLAGGITALARRRRD